jgi:small subunit ribosomal protein S13
MARIAGVDLNPNKRLWIGLTAIYGIGQHRARALAEKVGLDPTKKVGELRAVSKAICARRRR